MLIELVYDYIIMQYVVNISTLIGAFLWPVIS